MAEKNLNTRIINKHDTEANWSKAINFIPKQGELIIYDADENNVKIRFKIGDGLTTVNELPFAVEDITADWNQNDETAADYIKNRTHWEEPLVTNMLVDNVSVTIPTDYPYVQNPFTVDIVAGTTYFITFDNVVYERVAYLDAMYNSPTIGNMAIVNPTMFIDTGEPFSVQLYQGSIWFGASSSGTHTVTIQEVVSGGVHKIDPKFIHTPDWSAGANEVGYIANRTHWSEFVEIAIIDNVSLTLTDNGYGLYVSGLIACEPLYLGQPVTVVWDNVSYERAVTMGPNNLLYIGNPYLLFSNMGAPDTGEPFAIMPQATGIQFGCNVLPTSSPSLTITKKTEVVHKIDNKYLPDFPQNILDGSATGSIRTIGSQQESSSYTIGYHAFAEGYITEASGNYSHAECYRTKASGHYSHAEGNITEASGDESHAEGYDTEASGDYSHAEGSGTKATGEYSHAEGHHTEAKGQYSHAEGSYTEASGVYSHAEGCHTKASSYSHAEGGHTSALSTYQHVQGKYNIEDTENKYAHIIGNGTNSARSNAHTVDWDGIGWFKGGIKIGGTSQDDAAALSVLTSADIESITDNEINSICGTVIYLANEVAL